MDGNVIPERKNNEEPTAAALPAPPKLTAGLQYPLTGDEMPALKFDKRKAGK